jgi:alpha-galactosidase
MKSLYILFVAVLISLSAFGQKFDLAKTPPMGWNSWNKFACNINEDLIRQVADAMVATGMKDAGYVYINIDDCWQGTRDSLGFIRPDPDRFPSGMKKLADYVHSKGLKLGIYSDAGAHTCGGRAGSRGYENQDAITYAQWGIDYLKFDWCDTKGLSAPASYATMRDALYNAGHPIVFSICEWGDNNPTQWAPETGHLWRTTGDIQNCWDCEMGYGTWSKFGVLRILDKQNGLRKYAGPGHWNDPDMLEVGNGMTFIEDRAHFSLWCMLAAPLISGNDLRNMSQETTDILTNKEVIALDQDPLGVQCFKMADFGDFQIYAKPLANNEVALCFLNRGNETIKVNFNWKDYPVMDGQSGASFDFSRDTYRIRDLWQKKETGTTATPLKTELLPHDVIVVRLYK